MLLEHTDVTLVSTNNQEVPCHRFILAARSPVFKRYVIMFVQGLIERSENPRVPVLFGGHNLPHLVERVNQGPLITDGTEKQ